MPLSKNDIKYLRSLSQKKIREEEKKFILEGWLPLGEALGSDVAVEYVAVDKTSEGDPSRDKILSAAKKKSIRIHEITRKELDQVSNTVHSQGVLALIHKKEDRLSDLIEQKAPLLVALDGVADPGNLGSIVRSCDWFGVDGILMGTGCVELYNEKVVRSTAGSLFHLPIVEDLDLVSTLKQTSTAGYSVVSYSGDGTVSYLSGRLRLPAVLIFGSEAHGISEDVRKLSHTVLNIPHHGRAESLNVGVACGIVLAHLRGQSKQ
jgi:TrmH family RNA methyltransferase